MNAAVVRSFDAPPRFEAFADPPVSGGDVRIAVRAAALSNLVRAQASGKHYSSGEPPLVPGVDGVGVVADGSRVYFAFPAAPFGAMAETATVPAAYTARVPDGLDDVTAAAAANPGMSSTVALRHRARLAAGESVLINGATGVSGRLAIGVARAMGAGRIVATGRNPKHLAELTALGADVVVSLEAQPDELVETFRREMRAADVKVVLDYLWGAPAAAILASIATGATGAAAPRIRYVNIGNSAGAAIEVAAGTLRSSGLELLGSGLGSVAHADIVAAIGEFYIMFVERGLSIATRAVSLEHVESAWNDDAAGDRVVFTLPA